MARSDYSKVRSAPYRSGVRTSRNGRDFWIVQADNVFAIAANDVDASSHVAHCEMRWCIRVLGPLSLEHGNIATGLIVVLNLDVRLDRVTEFANFAWVNVVDCSSVSELSSSTQSLTSQSVVIRRA
jgi:hypothetical protein